MAEKKIKNLHELREFMKKEDMDYYKDPSEKRAVLSSGFLSLDDMLNGGYRAGTYVELFGEESTGKTYLALNAMKSCQENWGKPVCYLDFEKAWDAERAREIGLDLSPDMCDVFEPPTQEDGYDFLNVAIANDVYGVIVIDSVSSMAPTVETEEKMSKANVAAGARNNSKGLRVITAGLKNTVVIFINQMREKIGISFGDNRTTTGGRALLFYAHMRLQCDKLVREKEEVMLYDARKGDFDKGKLAPGHILKIRFKKSRMGNQDKSCDLVYDYDIGGVDRIEDIKEFLFNHGKIERSGNFYEISGYDKKVNGKKGLYKFLSENEDLVHKLVEEVKSDSSRNISV